MLEGCAWKGILDCVLIRDISVLPVACLAPHVSGKLPSFGILCAPKLKGKIIFSIFGPPCMDMILTLQYTHMQLYSFDMAQHQLQGRLV